MKKMFLIARRWIVQKFPVGRIKGALMDISFETKFLAPLTPDGK
jgi:hypothetical protein